MAEVLQQLTSALCLQVSLLQALAGGPVPVQALDGRPLQVGLGVDVLDMSCLPCRVLATGGRDAALLCAAVGQGSMCCYATGSAGHCMTASPGSQGACICAWSIQSLGAMLLRLPHWSLRFLLPYLLLARSVTILGKCHVAEPWHACRYSCIWRVSNLAGSCQWQTSLDWLQVAAPGVITPDSELVVRGEGMPRAGGAGRRDRGDLRVRFKIAFPPRLSPLQLAQLQAVLG